MRIKTLKIKNFRCFDELEINLEKTHALVGQNGTGKTTILDAISLAHSKNFTGSKIDEEDFHSENAETEMKIEVEYDESFEFSLYPHIPSHKKRGNVRCSRIILMAHRRKQKGRNSLFSEPIIASQTCVPDGCDYNSSGYIAFVEGEGEVFKPTHLFASTRGADWPDCIYLEKNRERHLRDSFNSLFQRLQRDLNWRFRKGWNQEGIKSTWDAFDTEVKTALQNAIGSATSVLDVVDDVKSGLGQLTNLDYSGLEISPLNIQNPFSQSFFSRRIGTSQIDIESMGAGIFNLAAQLFIEEQAKAEAGNLVFLVDEPEMHLHPQLQKALYDRYESSSFQTIYATHSDIMISIKNWRGVTRTSRHSPAEPQEGGAQPFTVMPQEDELVKDVHGKKIFEHLNDLAQYHYDKTVLMREHNEIFFAQKCLLVEGVVDKYGLPELAAKLGSPLSPHLTIIACGGKNNIKQFQTLCNVFGVPAFTVYDKDNGERGTDDNPIIHDLSQGNSFAFSPSFETVLRSGKGGKAIGNIYAMPADSIPLEVCQCIEEIKRWEASDET